MIKAKNNSKGYFSKTIKKVKNKIESKDKFG